MRGQYVLLRAFRNKPIVRRIWDADDDTVYICNEENFARLSAGLAGHWPVAFPRSDAFAHDALPAELVKRGQPVPNEVWEDLPPWVPAEAPEEQQNLTLHLVK